MTGIEVVLGVFGGVALGLVITAMRVVLIRRLVGDRRTTVPPSTEVLDAERQRPSNTRPMTDRTIR